MISLECLKSFNKTVGSDLFFITKATPYYKIPSIQKTGYNLLVKNIE